MIEFEPDPSGKPRMFIEGHQEDLRALARILYIAAREGSAASLAGPGRVQVVISRKDD